MPSEQPPWDQEILDQMKPNSVTFQWEGGDIRTYPVPMGTLDSMATAWSWIQERRPGLEEEHGPVRAVCFHLRSGEFRGLRIPPRNTGAPQGA